MKSFLSMFFAFALAFFIVQAIIIKGLKWA